jgi:hypothetical protein
MSAEKLEHCWHTDGSKLSFGDTASWHETCCWCGASRRAHQTKGPDPSHGPHAPPSMVNITYDVLEDRPCNRHASSVDDHGATRSSQPPSG